ncbi:RNA polymerase sigma factor sigF, chloroplastic isoform X1 [Solanum pennellii]|uniref:RNA polymerase sigma factor sigF, chloroplastic isoform X1 n=2 Tax=Solanum pennellii TaxID=28526 RepID=A0ABM1HN92_SOLPN|nr:RNA polymerase sigma factor sigF, chloroplastic isoform X1 [Solanum pennellii]
MEAAGRNLLSSPPTFSQKTQLRNCSSSVLMLHEHAAPVLSSVPHTYLGRYVPASAIGPEQQFENRLQLHLVKEEKTSLATIDRRLVEAASSELEENDAVDSEQNINALQVQLLHWPGPSYSFPPYYLKGKGPLSPNKEPLHSKGDKLMNFEPHSVVALARKALLASKEAALLAEDSKLLDDSHFPNFLSTNLVDDKLKEQRTVRSTRFIERQSRKRGAPKPIQEVQETNNRSGRPDVRRKVNESIDLNDPLRMFLWGPETKQLLTAKEESELIVKIQISMKLQEVKHQLQIQFAREPTSLEWAEAAGITSRELKSQLLSGKSSREKLINANLRMVVHIAKQYQGRGLNLQDLLQEGSMGLMKSVEKFKPQAGCRFPTYAYWWIRQSVRKAIFQHSRTIRLPENVYALLSKVKDAKRECIQQGNRHPTKEDIASCAGMSVERLQNLLSNVRTPLSMQQSVWSDQDTTFQEITADNAIEAPELSVSKQLMRRHIRGLLNVLSPKERKIIRLRFGIGDGKPKSLSEIGTVFGLSKERVRQLETRALYKLKQNLNKHGLDAYSDLLF